MQANLLVHERPRKLVIQPRTVTNKKSSFVLVFEILVGKDEEQARTGLSSNINCTARFQPAATFNSSEYSPLLASPIYGCLGLVQVEGEPYICVIDDATAVGELENSKIYRINNVVFFSLTSSHYDELSDNGSSYIQQREMTSINIDSTQDQFETIRHPCYYLQKFIASGSFYYSYDFDLTRTAQVRLQSADFGSFWDLSDDRFFWNRHIIKELLKFRRQLPAAERGLLDAEGILVMAISGFVRIDDVQIFGEKLKCGMISRLNCKRAGTRFNTRGVDDDGNVANNVETEIVIVSKDFYYSYVIIRGSVPVFWEQPGIQLGQHKIQISRSAAAAQPAFERHFNELLDRYGPQNVVNLLSQKEATSELVLSNAFNEGVSNMKVPESTIRMTNFDFHQVVKGNQFENLCILVNQVQDAIKGQKCFLMNLNTKEIISVQQGCFRVNCLDCLDRTNVVNGLLCKANMNIFTQAALKISSETLFNSCFNDIWADNGDELSKIYTGTGALKSGFTRTGKRTIVGLMDDAKKSAARFFVNNFQDKSKQEVIDGLLGKLSNQSGIRLFNPVREAVVQALNARFSEYASTASIKIHVSTWNVNGKQPLGESIIPWLTFTQFRDKPELFVIGFQEIVELSPQQIMATDNSKRAAWEELLLKTINIGSSGVQYVNFKSGQLVGAALIIIVRSDCVSHIRNVQGGIKKTGFAGLAGNKGGVAIRMDYHDSSLCFIAAHLAAGHSNVEDRNNDYRTINEGLVFQKGKKIQDHDKIIWLGDFNYRINLGNDEVRDRIDAQDLAYLFQQDQLNSSMQNGRAFQGFAEAPIKFLPTYKYDNGTNQYDTSEKNRIPAWTDRILFSGSDLTVLDYNRCELTSSDHKPVKALFKVELSIIDQVKKDAIERDLYRQYSGAAIVSPVPQTIFSGAPTTSVVPSAKVGTLIDFGDPDPIQTSQPIRAASANFNWWDDSTMPAMNTLSLSSSGNMPKSGSYNAEINKGKEPPMKPAKPASLSAAPSFTSAQAPALPPRQATLTKSASATSYQPFQGFSSQPTFNAPPPTQNNSWASFGAVQAQGPPPKGLDASGNQPKQPPLPPRTTIQNPFEDPFNDPWVHQ